MKKKKIFNYGKLVSDLRVYLRFFQCEELEEAERNNEKMSIRELVREEIML